MVFAVPYPTDVIEKHMRIAFLDLTDFDEVKRLATGKNEKGQYILPSRQASLDFLEIYFGNMVTQNF
jgi:hypothetical protein